MEKVNEYGLLSPEKVHLKMNLAGLGSRFAACFIDGIVLFVLFILLICLFAITSFFHHGAGLWETLMFTVLAVMAVVLTVILVLSVLGGYFIFFETIWNGQTPGKRFFQLRVVRADGGPVTLTAVLIRNIIRLIDSLPFLYALGITSVLLSKKNQRLGDMAAGTIVVREHNQEAPAAINFAAQETPWSATARLHIHEIGEGDFAVLKKFLLRRETMKQAEVWAMEQKLAVFFCRKLGLNLAEIGEAGEFLKQVAAIYQHR